jgi:hypothetical protein
MVGVFISPLHDEKDFLDSTAWTGLATLDIILQRSLKHYPPFPDCSRRKPLGRGAGSVMMMDI